MTFRGWIFADGIEGAGERALAILYNQGLVKDWTSESNRDALFRGNVCTVNDTWDLPDWILKELDRILKYYRQAQKDELMAKAGGKPAKAAKKKPTANAAEMSLF